MKHVDEDGMRASFSKVASLLVLAMLTACADDDAQMPPPASPAVVQNTTYNNITNIYNAPNTVNDAGSAIVAAAPVSNDAPTSPAMIDAAAPSVRVPRATTVSGTPRDLRSTGVAACDEYLDRVESCSRSLMPSNPEADRGFQRIQMALDMSRRAWRHAAENPAQRPELARTCNDARALYESSVEDKCP